jgi:hypothetical protein
MKTKFFLAALCSLTIMVAIYAARKQAIPAELKSFIVTESIASLKQNALTRHTVGHTIAVRDNGSWVEVTSAEGAPTRVIYDTERGVLTVVEEEAKATETVKMSSHMIQEKKITAFSSCGGTAAGEMLGQPVEYQQVFTTIAGPTATNQDVIQSSKFWRAPALGCTPLREERIQKDSQSGDLLADAIHQAVALSFEPVDKYFEIPTGYAEMTPSEVSAENYRLHPGEFGGPPTPRPHLDDNYRRMHDALTQAPN